MPSVGTSKQALQSYLATQAIHWLPNGGSGAAFQHAGSFLGHYRLSSQVRRHVLRALRSAATILIPSRIYQLLRAFAKESV